MDRETTRRAGIVLGTVLAVLLLASCAAQSNAAVVPTGGANFWYGLWHGLILPITFVVSLFNDDVGVYQVANEGHWYDFGFVLGAGGLGLPGLFRCRRHRR